MKKIEELFYNRFARWNITLPLENIKNRTGGYISKDGWLIQYCFGKGETVEYLDYYAAHRMTDDTHIRIYSDGRTEDLPALQSIRKVGKDPEEDQKFKDEYEEYNKKVVETLARKGFDKFTINMYLHAGMDKDK
jgi:hypothetical protein